MTTRDLLYPACCALAAASCSDGDGRDTGLVDARCRQLTSQLQVEDKFRQRSATFIAGEPIELSMRITNRGRVPATLGYDGCPEIRFVIMDSRGDTVFDTLPEGTPCTLQLRLVPYQPGETRSFEFEWTQTRGDDGSHVPSGPYTIDARDRSIECRGALDASGDFTIQ